jgi:electron transfer flavoprotein beta subunit
LRIVVCVKQVPDSAAQLSVKEGKPDWGDAPLVINPWDEFAVEAALRQVEAQSGEVIALTVGSEGTKEALKHALAMGCSQAVLVNDPALEQVDSLMVAKILSAAIQKISAEGGPVDLAMFGRQAIDTDTGVTAIQAARCLGWPSLSLVSAIHSLDSSAGLIQVERSIEEGRQIIQSRLPAVVSVVKDIAEPRYPSFMGIRKASRAVIPSWTLADLNLTDLRPVVSMLAILKPPTREIQTEILSGANAKEIANKLVDKILEEKVL